MSPRGLHSSPDRRSSASCHTFRLGVQAELGSARRPFSSFEIPIRTAGFGLGGLHLEARGELDDPSRARSEDLGSFVIAPSFGLVARLADHVALTAEAGLVFTLPTLKIDMGSERLGVVGRPMMLASHGLLVTF